MNESNPPLSLKVFVEAVAQGDDALEDIFEQLKPLGPQATHLLLLRALKHESIPVRQAASTALSEMGSEISSFAADLAPALRDHDPVVRGNIALALAGVGRPAAEALEDLDTALGAEEDGWATAMMIEAITKIEQACASAS